jgi:hypothetical protein
MDVRVDQRGHHRLSGERDPRGAGGRRQIPFPADPGEAVVLDDERGVLDRRRAIADYQSCAFKQRRWCRRRLAARICRQRANQYNERRREILCEKTSPDLLLPC